MIMSHLAGELMKQRAAEAQERADQSRLAAVAKKAARERRRAAKAASRKPAPQGAPDVKPEPAANAEQGTVMSC